MKYFKEGRTEHGYGDNGIILNDHIFSISKNGDTVCFWGECDGCYSESFTKEKAIELLREAIEWIENVPVP